MIISYNTNNHRSGSERGRGSWARLRGGSGSGALRRRLPLSAMSATGTPELRERSASAPKVRMRCE
eukprot:3278116-Pleurochrysis_carterae.AAC.1